MKPKILSVNEPKSAAISKRPGIITDVALLQKRTGTFEYITAPIDANGQDLFDFGQVVKVKAIREYGSTDGSINLVAITDGARSIARVLKPHPS